MPEITPEQLVAQLRRERALLEPLLANEMAGRRHLMQPAMSAPPDIPVPVAEVAPLPPVQAQYEEVLRKLGAAEAGLALNTDPARTSTKDADQEAIAIALLFKSDMTIAEIADHLDVSRTSLYRWEKFCEAAESAGKMKPRKTGGRLPKGSKTDGRIEAIDPHVDE